jgi:hypothetical protein
VLIAVDARGEAVPLDRLPRRPRLSIALAMPPNAPNNGPWLLAGTSDAALLDDLEKLPLNASHLSRSIPARHSWDGQRLVLEPERELIAGAEYTLAVPRKAAIGSAQPLATALLVDDSPFAGAAARATFPPAEAASVPTDLAFALISFDGVVQGSEHGVWLADDQGLAHPARIEEVACAEFDSAAISCIQLLPDLPLEPARRYLLRTGRALIDGHGATVTELHAGFTTQPEQHQEPPAWQRRSCAMDEQTLPRGCALLSDERIELQLFQNPGVRVLAELAGQRIALLPASLSSPVRFDGLIPDHDYALSLESIDGSLRAEHLRVPLRTAPRLPTLAITELNADPRGREPEQEYVELWNFGAESQTLAGLHLGDSVNELGAPLPDQYTVAPGARALLVSDGYDPLDGRDETPSPGSLLVRVGKSLTRGGLTNSGERLYLRTATGYRVSTAPALPAPREGQCLVRSADQHGLGEDWTLADCTPGR